LLSTAAQELGEAQDTQVSPLLPPLVSTRLGVPHLPARKTATSPLLSTMAQKLGVGQDTEFTTVPLAASTATGRPQPVAAWAEGAPARSGGQPGASVDAAATWGQAGTAVKQDSPASKLTRGRGQRNVLNLARPPRPVGHTAPPAVSAPKSPAGRGAGRLPRGYARPRAGPLRSVPPPPATIALAVGSPFGSVRQECSTPQSVQPQRSWSPSLPDHRQYRVGAGDSGQRHLPSTLPPR